MNMKHLILILLLFAGLPFAVAQKSNKKCKEGCAPKVSIYAVQGDSVNLLSYLQKDKETRIKVVLEGGIEKVKNTVYVTSKHAFVKKDTSTTNEYIVIPQNETCEIIVDVKTSEPYFSIKEIEKNGKKIKKTVAFPPKTYMVGYERYEVR